MPSKDSKLEKAREVVDILEEISTLLVCVFMNGEIWQTRL